MQDFLALLQRHKLQKPGWEMLRLSCPRKLFFLQPEFVNRYYREAELPPEELAGVLAFAGKADGDPLLRGLAWYLHRLYLRPGEFNRDTFPETIDILGEAETGLLYLLVQLTLIPEVTGRMVQNGYPAGYAAAAMTRIGTLTGFYAQAHHGLFGLRAVSMPFMLNFLTLAMFRIGRFDFVPEILGDEFPRVYRSDRETAAFCGDGWLIDANGDRMAENTPGARPAKLTVTADTVTGRPVDLRTGKVLPGERTVSLKEFRPLALPGDTALHFHIPGGGGMTPEKCRASFAEALAFYREYFPELTIKVITSRSWIFNPAWLDYLPDSNLSALIRYGALFPSVNTGLDGLYFLFGRTDWDFASYPRDNSVRRAMLDALRDRGRLYAPGWFIAPDEI